MTAGGKVTLADGAVVDIGGSAVLSSPDTVLIFKGGKFSLQPVDSGLGSSGLDVFALRASEFDASGLSAANNAAVLMGMPDESPRVFPVSETDLMASALAGFRYVLPDTFVVLDPEVVLPDVVAPGSPSLSGRSLRYFTGEQDAAEGIRIRFLYPRVNLGTPYYVGTTKAVRSKAARDDGQADAGEGVR